MISAVMYAVDPPVLQQDRPGHAHRQDVLRAGPDHLVDAEVERGEAALVAAHGLVVEPDLGREVDRVEVQADDAALPRRGDREGVAVERDPLVVLLRQLPAARDRDRSGLSLRKMPVDEPPARLPLVLPVEDDLPGPVQGEGVPERRFCRAGRCPRDERQRHEHRHSQGFHRSSETQVHHGTLQDRGLRPTALRAEA